MFGRCLKMSKEVTMAEFNFSKSTFKNTFEWLLHNTSFLSCIGRLHSHHSQEIDDTDTDLEKALIEKYYQDEDEDAFDDEYNNRNYDSEFDETDELLADPRPYPRPRPWRWIRRVRIGCTIRCGSYNWCLLRKRNHRRCKYPRGCNCRRFAWEKK